MSDHQLIRTADKQYHCTVCMANWKSKPSTYCPGVRRYESLSEAPDNLKLLSYLSRRNLKPKDGVKHVAVLGREYHKLYAIEDTEVDDPDLPPIVEWDKRDGLMTRGEVRKLKKKPIDGIKPSAVAYIWDKDCEEGKWIPLYLEKDIEWDLMRDDYISKSALRDNYLLSEGWIKNIGKEDKLEDNPHSRYYAPMKLYSRKRVEKFLAENAVDYANWLIKRDKNIEIYKANKEQIQAGAARYREEQRIVRREARRVEYSMRQTSHQEALIDGNRTLSSFVKSFREEGIDNITITTQIKCCLTCASGCAYQKGFLCAIHPSGPSQLPCPDFSNRIGNIDI